MTTMILPAHFIKAFRDKYFAPCCFGKLDLSVSTESAVIIISIFASFASSRFSLCLSY